MIAPSELRKVAKPHCFTEKPAKVMPCTVDDAWLPAGADAGDFEAIISWFTHLLPLQPRFLFLCDPSAQHKEAYAPDASEWKRLPASSECCHWYRHSKTKLSTWAHAVLRFPRQHDARPVQDMAVLTETTRKMEFQSNHHKQCDSSAVRKKY